MIRVYVAIAVVIVIVVCLLGAVNQGDREVWEYGVFQVYHSTLSYTNEAKKLLPLMSDKDKKFKTYTWSVGTSVIVANNIKDFMLYCDFDDQGHASEEVLINCFGDQGWEMFDYDCDFGRHTTESTITEHFDKKYFFKRRGDKT